MGNQEDKKPLLTDFLVTKTERKSGLSDFFKKQKIEISFKRYFIDALGAMALGLFASLLIGTIINTLAMLFPAEGGIYKALTEIGGYAQKASGPAMAMAIGYSLQAPPLVLFSLAGVGLAANSYGGAGGPLALFFVVILAAELGKLISKTTPVDIILTPFVTIVSGGLLSMTIAPPIGALSNQFGVFIMNMTNEEPFIMGIVVSVVMGILLTLPISSAAIAHSFGLVGLAGGAALAGCSAQMVGFAVMSYKENGFGGLLAQGLGTSMLQMPNIVKKPVVWIPPILASAITGPIATLYFKLEMNGAPISSGMGTSGLVGQIGTITGWLQPSEKALEAGAAAIQAGPKEWLGLLLLSFVLPAVLTGLIGFVFRRLGWIKAGDLTLPQT